MKLLKNSTVSFTITSRERYLDKLKARIDIVREGLVSNPLDVDLETTISELMLEVRKLIFDDKWVNPLPVSNWLVVVNFILSLNEVSVSARKNNRSLNFSAQRSVFLILGYIFNHPQYSKLCDRWSTANEYNIFDVIQTMFGEAERQNYDPCIFGDLFAEGEWVSYIFGYMTFKLRYSPNQEGVASALDLWESFVSYSARSNPDRIPKLFNNIKESSTSSLYGHLPMPTMLSNSVKFKLWEKKIEGIGPFRVTTMRQCEAAYRVLHGEVVDGEWAVFNGAFGEETQFIAGTLPEIEDVWAVCIQGSVFDSIAYMYGVCAFNDLWQEIRECWYLSQPEDADAIYCDHQFFSRSPQAFASWISNHVIQMDRTIYERHDLKVHVAAACTVLIGDMLNAGVSPSFMFGTIAKAEELERFISLLHNKKDILLRESVRAAFCWGYSEAKSIRLKVIDFLDSELLRCKKYIADSLKRCIPNTSIYSADIDLNRGDRELVYEAWNQTNQNFWTYFSVSPGIKVSFSRSVFPDVVQVGFKAHESYFLSVRSGKRLHGLDFAGIEVACQLNNQIAQKLKAMAGCPVSDIGKDCTWFISEEDWDVQGWNRLKTRYGFDNHSDRTVRVGGKQSFVVEKDAAELMLHAWEFMPWSGGKYPVVVYGFTEFSEFTTGVSSVYYKFNVLNPSGIHLL